MKQNMLHVMLLKLDYDYIKEVLKWKFVRWNF